MEYKKFGNLYVVRLERGEEIIETLKAFARENHVTLGSISGIGAVNKANLGLFDTSSRKYIPREYTGDFEIASLTGNITTMDGDVYLHIHACIADSNSKTYGGHLSNALVSVTCELFINYADGMVGREFDSSVGINLMRF